MNTATLLTVQAPVIIEVLVLAVLFFLMPGLTRPSLFFSVTIDPAFRQSQRGRSIVTRYRTVIVAGSALAVAAALWIPGDARPAGMWLPIVVALATAIVAFLDARRRVLPHAAEPDSQREAELAPRHGRLPGGLRAQAGPFVILGGAAAWLSLHWQSIPARFPIHWRLDGTPDGWATRSPWGVFGVLGISALTCLVLLLVGWGVARWSRQVHASGPQGEAERRFRTMILLLLLVSEYMLAAISAWIGISPLTGPTPPTRTANVILAVFIAAIVVIVVLLIRAGQGGARIDGGAGGEERPTGDRSEDRFWKAGVFYVNPDDPAIFVEKRFGIGYTLNFGHRWVWATLAVVGLLAALCFAITALG
ncbi:MAG: DUF1648 domain-containing protein [Acidobacteria bacterium]|nr:DUF1648 domain-containing protein [Acidobacteriota bacterium]